MPAINLIRPSFSKHFQDAHDNVFLSCADRQRTIWELEVGKTLFKEGERWVIKHQADDVKTGRAFQASTATTYL